MRIGGMIAAIGLCCLTGCGDDGPKMHSVSGKVVLTGGDASQLAGHHIEGALESDSTVRTSGLIGADGSFTLESLHDGKVRKGAREGKYLVRIIPGDEDSEGKKLRKPPVAAKFLKFESSGLSFQVPTSEPVTLTLTPR